MADYLDKHKEPEKDKPQRALKEYLYTIAIKEGESYRNFMMRPETSYKALVRNNAALPDELRLLLKKMALDSTSEAMALTSTSGSLKYDEVAKAIRNVFPVGWARIRRKLRTSS